MSAFGIQNAKDSNPVLVLRDNLGTIIPPKDLADIILTFHSGSSFYLDATISSGDAHPDIGMVTPYMFENYLIKNFNDLLKHKNCTELAKKERRAIINAAVSFMTETYGISHVTKSREVMTARAAVILFPALKDKQAEDEGIVCSVHRTSTYSYFECYVDLHGYFSLKILFICRIF